MSTGVSVGVSAGVSSPSARTALPKLFLTASSADTASPLIASTALTSFAKSSASPIDSALTAPIANIAISNTAITTVNLLSFII